MRGLRSLIDFESCLNAANQFQPRRVSPALVETLLELTSFLPVNVSLKQRFYTAKANITIWPSCSLNTCTNLSIWDNFKNIYRPYCSKICAAHDMRGQRGKNRAKSRNNFRIIEANTIEELIPLLKRQDGNFNGNLTKHLSDHHIKMIEDACPSGGSILSKLFVIDGYTLPHCVQCEKEIPIARKSDFGKIFCSQKCSNANKAKIQKTKNVCMERYGVASNLLDGVISPELSEQLRNGIVGKLYQDENLNGSRIAERLGISVSVACGYLNRWATENGIQLSGGRSMLERTIEEKLSLYGIVPEHSRRDIIAPYEIDLWLPSHNVGIEIHGDYWHSDRHKSPEYHAQKATLADEAGIHLYQFFEHEIHDKTNIITSMVMSRASSITSIPARKCKVVSLSSTRYNKFVADNHIQGTVNTSIRLGLEYDGVLVSVAGFGKPRFSKHDYELYRSCSLLNNRVHGGFSKLLSAFRKEHVGSIVTYADRRFSSKTNNVYQKTGFTYEGTSTPGYFYIKNGNKVSRYMAQKHKLQKILGPCYNESLTETENMAAAGYFKIWDAGQLIYRMD